MLTQTYNAAQLTYLRKHLYIMPKAARDIPCEAHGVIAVYLHRFGRNGRVFYVGVGRRREPYERARRRRDWRQAAEGHSISVEIVKRWKVPPHTLDPLLARTQPTANSLPALRAMMATPHALWCTPDQARLEAAYRAAHILKRALRRKYGLIVPDEHRHPHGSFARYARFGCRCADCRAANARFHRALRSRRRARLQVAKGVRHGVRSSYVNHGCRCEACSAAERRYNAAAWRRRR
jgi:hypothetical protein